MDVIVFLLIAIFIVWLVKILIGEIAPQATPQIQLVILLLVLIVLFGWGFGYGGYHQLPWSHR